MNVKRERFSLKISHSFGKAIDCKDPYTEKHSSNVALLAEGLGKELNNSFNVNINIENLNISGYLHDLGKIGINDNILNKPSKTNESEFAAIRIHPKLGYDILKDSGLEESIVEGVYQHHEAFDGSGYPQGLKGKKIHSFGRILAIADSYDTITSKRAYKSEFKSPLEALNDLKTSKNSKNYDPKFVNAFERYLISESII